MSQCIYNELIKTVNENSSSVISACDAVLKLILSKHREDHINYFETFLKELDVTEVETDDFDGFFAQMQEENISPEQKEADFLGARIISNLIKKNVSEKEFYEDLWTRLMDDVVSGDNSSKAVLLVRFWVDPRIPYYKLPVSCVMDNDEYRAAFNTVVPQLKKARFIIHAGLPQKTQKTSLLMNLANEIEDDRKRAVFWAVVLDQEAIRQQQIRLDYADESDEHEE